MTTWTKPNRGATNDWLTPPDIVESLGPFDLDPCCPEKMPWRTAKRMICQPENGLIEKWEGMVWMNPPYGQETGTWLKKLADHGNGIALIFARTDTEMFDKYVWMRAQAVRFITGRLFFYTLDGKRGPGNAGGASVLVAYGCCAAERLKRSTIKGAFFRC